MRERLHSLISEHQASKLYGLSLFGTRMQIYTLDLAISNSTIYPQQEPYLPTAGNVHNYLQGQWELDLLEPQGCAALFDLVADIKQTHPLTAD